MPSTVQEAKKPAHKYTKKELVSKLQDLDWATLRQILIYLNGSQDRDGWVERKLKNLSESHPPHIRRAWYAGRFVYSCNRINRRHRDRQQEHIYHGLGVTELVLAFSQAATGRIEYLPLSWYQGLGLQPDKAIRLASGVTLDCEFCTDDNFERRLEYKIRRYEDFLARYERHIAVFVCDVPQAMLVSAISRYHPSGGGMYFTDLPAFLALPYGHALSEAIYFWEDGQKYPLRA